MKPTFRYICTLAALGAAACGAEADGNEQLAGGDPAAEGTAEPCEGDIGSVREMLGTATGTRPLLVILLQRDAATPLARSAAWYDSRIFGPAFPNVAGYFSAMSKNTFGYSRAQVVSVTDRTDAAFLTRAGVTAGMGTTTATRLRARMLAEDAGFPFENFDANGDGQVTTSELAVLTIDNYSTSSGQNGNPGCIDHPGGIEVCTSVALAGHQSNLVNFVHELSHQLGTQDLYGANNMCQSNRETIMSCTAGGVEGATLYNIDPWHRMELGWAGRGSSVTGDSGSAVLQPVATYNAANPGSERLVLDRGANQEKLYIEHRRRDTAYERDVAAENIVFWYTKTAADGESIVQIPALGAGGNDGANFVLAPNRCVGDPMDPNSRGRTNRATVAGSSYRMKWLDGTDTGYLFTIGSPGANGAVSVSWSRTTETAACPEAPPGAGFAWVDIGNGSVNPSYSYSTSNGPVSVSSTTTGSYVVSFSGLARAGGNAQVVAYGTNSVRCKVSGWGPSGTSEQVSVRCHTSTGAAANSAFVVQFGTQNQSNDAAAYLWADQASAASYNPAAAYSWNSTGGTNRITRTGTGAYDAYLPGLAVSGGNVQVTAYGTTGDHCKVLSWGSSGTEERVSVRCFNTSGSAVDTRFALSFSGHQQVGLFDNGAYAWANNSTSASYSPSASYSYNSNSLIGCVPLGTNTAGRYGTGSYFMRHSDLNPIESAARVTAYGSGGAYCKVASWSASGTGVEVQTRCFSATGAAADTQYVESYTTGWFRGPC